ncbi:MAG: hypothetical protein QG578_1311 [Thermodesulfobacteriota bacterium]|nr:hypothetical protein [Thermodesulfobacteriota bacterium]
MVKGKGCTAFLPLFFYINAEKDNAREIHATDNK